MTAALQAGQEMARRSCFSLDSGNVQDLMSLTKGAEKEELAAGPEVVMNTVAVRA